MMPREDIADDGRRKAKLRRTKAEMARPGERGWPETRIRLREVDR